MLLTLRKASEENPSVFPFKMRFKRYTNISALKTTKWNGMYQIYWLHSLGRGPCSVHNFFELSKPYESFNHSAHLVSAMVDYRTVQSCRSRILFHFHLKRYARIIPASSNGRETGKSKCNRKYKQCALPMGSDSHTSALPGAEGWPFLSFTFQGQFLPGPL